MQPPYDAGFNLVFFAYSHNTGSVAFIDEPWVKDLDFTTLRKHNTSFISTDMQDRHSDSV